MKGIFAAAFLISVVPGIIAPAAAVATILPILADPTYFGNMQYGYWDGLEQLGSANNPFVGGDIHLSGSAVSLGFRRPLGGFKRANFEGKWGHCWWYCGGVGSG